MNTEKTVSLNDMFKQYTITPEDMATLWLLESSENIDEWNRFIKDIKNMALRSAIEQSGIIHKILK